MPPLRQCYHFGNATISAMPPLPQCHHFGKATTCGNCYHFCNATTSAMPPLPQCHHFRNATTSAIATTSAMLPPFRQCQQSDNALINNILPPRLSPSDYQEPDYQEPRLNSEGVDDKTPTKSLTLACYATLLPDKEDGKTQQNRPQLWIHHPTSPFFPNTANLLRVPNGSTIIHPNIIPTAAPTKVLRVPDGVFKHTDEVNKVRRPSHIN